jgi:ABC-2 type transport system permease protein
MMNPVVYLINAFRWSFFETTDVSLGLSLAMIGLFFVVCLTVASMMFKTGYRIKH